MVPVERKETATDLEWGRRERGRNERGVEDAGVERGLGGGIKTKGEAKERQMEVVERRELDTGEGQKRRGRQKCELFSRKTYLFPFCPFRCPSLTIKV